jgi:hypothetical protein
MSKKEKIRFGIIVILILLSRVPFIFHGYGSEEDAWAMPLVTERIATTGVYEVSRLPGHPFQELTYTMMWNAGPVAYNILTILISTLGLGSFMLALFRLSVKQWDWAGIGFAFTPIVYINCTNDMDYMWATGFLMIAFFQLVNKNPFLAGLFIAMAIGCRITSGAMLIPFLLFLWHTTEGSNRNKFLIKLISATAFFTFLIFIPVIMNYGFSFFTYYEHFPIPGFAKNFYKGTIAVWGAPGFIAILSGIVYSVYQYKTKQQSTENEGTGRTILLICCLLVVVLYTVAYIKMPLKAAFLIPLVPFVWAGLAIQLPKRIYMTLVVVIIISSFTFGINLADPLRGSKKSNFSVEKTISNQKVVFDILSGPVLADLTKRQQRTRYAESVLKVTTTIKEPTYIIAGWWLADLLVLQRGKENKNVVFGYYTDQPTLEKYRSAGYRIYYLPEQNEFNDLRFKSDFTNRYGALLKTGISDNF